MSENKVMLATTRATDETTRSIHDDYTATLHNLATACYELSEEKCKEGLFFTYRVEPKENPYGVYLRGFEKESVRYGYICNTCHHFLRTYGNAVYINKDGSLESVIWNPDVAVGYMKPIIKALKDNVENGRVINIIRINPNYKADVIRKNDTTVLFGDKEKGGYNHFYGEFYKPTIGGAYTTEENIDLKSVVDNFKNLFEKFNQKDVDTAFNIASTNMLCDARKSAGKFKVLRDIFTDILSTKNEKNKYHKIVRYACVYNELLYGFLGSVDGALLEDVSQGYDPEDCAARYNYKMNPIRYKRPTAAPTKALVKEAETIIANMGLEDSLKRRIAKLSDIPEDKFIWKPVEHKKEVTKESTGIFGSVETKDDIKSKKEEKPVLNITNHDQRITYNKFKRDVLPITESMRVFMPNTMFGNVNRLLYPFTQYTTEAVEGSKPILKYDSVDQRNPFVAYMYNGGSPKVNFGLGYTGEFVDVVAVIPHPEAMNTEDVKDIITGAVFVLKDCKDDIMNGGLGLFPECLIPELYPVRKVIESFSNNGKLEDIDINEQAAAGIMLLENYSLTVEVKTCNNTLETYTIDRLE